MLSREIEELTLNAWPPRETLYLDGWLLTFNDGYTRRANSVHPLYPSHHPVAEKIAMCEAAYAARGHDTTFKITSSESGAELDAVLEVLGYSRIAPTSVQTADLSDLSPSVSAPPWNAERPARQDEPLPNAERSHVHLSATLSGEWFSAFNRLTATPESLQTSERALLERIVPPHAFASITADATPAAVGLAVAERGWVGLFDIVVAPAFRNQGLGRTLCTALLAWARTTQNATTAHLGVLEANAPARRLYARLGFQERYTYWFRHKPLNRE